MHVWFYGGNITNIEKLTAEKLIKANAINFNSVVEDISFYNSITEVEGQLL